MSPLTSADIPNADPPVEGWERIPEDVWRGQTGHVERYQWAAGFIHPGDVVIDVACGIGYGAEVLKDTECVYWGVDRPGVPSATFAPFGYFIETDVDTWTPRMRFDVVVCFETLEHVRYPARLARILSKARREILVSVPTVPTVGINPWHLSDFEEDDIPPMFDGWTEAERWHQPQERSHVYRFTR